MVIWSNSAGSIEKGSIEKTTIGMRHPALFESQNICVLLVKGFPLYRVSTKAKLTDGVSPSTKGYPCSLET